MIKKSIISIGLFIVLLSILGYYLYNAKINRDNLGALNQNIQTLLILNKDFDLYIKDTLTYDNFDTINQKIKNFKQELTNISNNDLIKTNLNSNIEQLRQKANKKFEALSKVKSYRAILNNSFRIIQKLYNKGISKDLSSLYTYILTIDKNPELTQQDLHKYSISNQVDKLFLRHANIILNYHFLIKDIYNEIQLLALDKELQNFHNYYKKFAHQSTKKAQLSIITLFVLLIILIIVYLIYDYKLIVLNHELLKFRSTIENSDNIVVITDAQEKIKYVNDAFVKTTGYTFEEVKGQSPSILSSGKQSKEFYEDLKSTIHSGKKWQGEFINKAKNGNLTYEKASITPSFDTNGNIEEFIAIKLNVTKETVANQQLKEKEQLLVQQSKMAAMGEMIGNIAHQWRQPLSIISSISTFLIMQKQANLVLSVDEEMEQLKKINQTVQYLSKTIDDFRNFFKPNKSKTKFKLYEVYQKAINLVNAKFSSLEIIIDEDIDKNIELESLDGEIIQVIINFLNNARDILQTKEQVRLIKVKIFKEDNYAVLEVIDNAGGVPADIINRVFEPYFTTKHKSQGTGIGLYMSKEMIEKHIHGIIGVENRSIEFNNITYNGACFYIKIPL